MQLLQKLITSFALLVAVSAAKIKFNTLTTVCSKSDPKLNECALKSSNQIVPNLLKGIREYGIPPLNPLKLPLMELSQSDKPVGLKLNVTDSVHDGLKDIKFTSFKFSEGDLGKFEAVVKVPRYSITGVCDLGGKILLLPITGHGPCNLTTFGMEVKLISAASPTKVKNGQKHYDSESFKIEFSATGGYFKLEGLFGGNKELGDTMNRFLNENALEVINGMKPTLEKVWSHVFGQLIERLYTSVPVDELLKP